MKVWLLHMDSYGEVSVFSEDTDVTQIPFVKEELGYLSGGYEEECEDFKRDVQRAVQRGYGSASIEERFHVELTDVETL